MRGLPHVRWERAGAPEYSCAAPVVLGEYLLQAWFLLMNGMFLFLSQGLGLGSPIELLGCAAVREANGSSPPVGYPSVKRAIIDTHFHLDSFSSHQGCSLSDLESSISKPLLVSIPFAIANYVFPDKWSRLSEHVRADPRLRITLGVHPHMITESGNFFVWQTGGIIGSVPRSRWSG